MRAALRSASRPSLVLSDFGFRPSFGVSGFGLRISRSSQPRRRPCRLPRRPLRQRMRPPTLRAARHRKLRPAMRTRGVRLERVERIRAFVAPPQRTDDRRLLAGRAHKPAPARQLRNPRQHPRLHQPSPAVQQDEHAQDAEPDVMPQHGQHDQAPTPINPITTVTIRLRARPSTNQSSDCKIWPPSSG